MPISPLLISVLVVALVLARGVPSLFTTLVSSPRTADLASRVLLFFLVHEAPFRALLLAFRFLVMGLFLWCFLDGLVGHVPVFSWVGLVQAGVVRFGLVEGGYAVDAVVVFEWDSHFELGFGLSADLLG